MFGRIYRIFQRYADCHVHFDRPGKALEGVQGRIDRIEMRQNRIIVEGWVAAKRVGIELDSVHSWCSPELAKPGTDEKGFKLSVPFRAGLLEFLVESEAQPLRFELTRFAPWRVSLARQMLWPRFFGDILRLLPHIYRWKRKGDLSAREHVKEGLGLVPRAQPTQMQAQLFGAKPAVTVPYTNATIILPVYNAPELVRECLQRVAAHTGTKWRMVLIDDASPDPLIAPILSDWANDLEHRDQVTLLHNETNLGFVGTVNRGFETALANWPDDPVVLLNSDALVPHGWLSRLLAPLAEPNIASVTPFSNDAEIFTAPVICQRYGLKAGQADALDVVAKQITLDPTEVDAPTGVGFCMAMSPRFLQKIPAFDTVFGRGYGEETDWCQKARALGGRHVCAVNLFVEHRGGESFGSAQKQQLLEKNLAVISRRYPAYDGEVQDFLQNDPLTTPRLALAIAWASLQQSEPIPMYIAHAMGGGADVWLQNHIARDVAQKRSAFVLRVGQAYRYLVELHSPHGVTQGLCNDEGLVLELASLVQNGRVVYSCGVGERDAYGLPELIEKLAGCRGSAETHPIEVLFHDFFPVSPSYTLLGEDGRYHGVPSGRQADSAHSLERPGGKLVTLDMWQEAWGRVMGLADQVVVFSDSSKDIVLEAYPQVENSIVVKPHAVPNGVTPIKPVKGNVPVIGVLGNIGFHKGAAVLQKLSRELARSGAARLVVIGQLDPAYKLDKRSATVHGSYLLSDLPGLVQKYEISAWLIPSIWPETFSFTTHEALATGMPVICFDLGAQGGTVRKALKKGAPGVVLSLDQVDAQPLAQAINGYFEQVDDGNKT